MLVTSFLAWIENAGPQERAEATDMLAHAYLSLDFPKTAAEHFAKFKAPPGIDKALPKKKHEPFHKLTAREQGLVCRLGGILRLADGLDRRRCGAVERISCVVQGDLARMAVAGSDDLAVELFGGSAKKELFEKAFGLQVLFAVQPQSGS